MDIETRLRELANLAISTLDGQQDYFHEDDLKEKRKLLDLSKKRERDLRFFSLHCLDSLGSDSQKPNG